MAPQITDKCIILNNGQKMPLLGLGCCQSLGNEVESAVEAALDCGYKHIDTAYNYLNEEQVGRGLHNWLKKTGTNREEIFVVTKLPMIGMYEGGVEKFLKISLKKLNLAYLDLYLIHCPVGMKGKNDEDVFPSDGKGGIVTDNTTDLIAIWKEMEKMVHLGLTKSIGVSNFSVKQMRKMNVIAEISPTVNQFEMNACFQQKELVEFCNQNNFVVTAYAPLGSPGRNNLPEDTKNDAKSAPNLLKNPVVQLIAGKHKVTSAQVLIRYLIQKGIVAIPKSVNPDRIKSNMEVFNFTLDEVDNAALLMLDLGEEGRSFTFCYFPGIKEHPENFV